MTSVASRMSERGVIRYIVLAAIAAVGWGGKVVIDRLLIHFDKTEMVMETTARAIERMTFDMQSGRETAVAKITAEVEQCCPPTRRRP